MNRWKTAALLKDRTRRAIRDRLQAGESAGAIGQDYGVPVAFVTALGQWQWSADAADPALLSALKLYVDHFGDPLKVARAAIQKAEG